jgi:hypothetical protein
MPKRADQTTDKPEINQLRLKVMGHRLMASLVTSYPIQHLKVARYVQSLGHAFVTPFYVKL